MANYNYEAQEKVVSALYDVIRINDTNPKNCTATDIDGSNRVEVNLSAISEGLEKIMAAFGYEVQPVD